MTERLNSFGQPLGAPVPGWTPRELPPRSAMIGRYCRVEPLEPQHHAADLYTALEAAGDGRLWTYLSSGPFADLDAYRSWLASIAGKDDPMFHAIIDGESGRAVGLAAYLRIDRKMGVIEVGHLLFSPLLQRRRAASEAMYLMMRQAFDKLGYRRYEWKCDSLNAPSRTAAARLGFRFEGIFRQAVVYKGRSRDTAWFAIIDRDWSALKAAFACWLDPANFDDAGNQRQRLSALTQSALAGRAEED